MNPRSQAELEPSSGRQAQAKATALRALLRPEGRSARVLTEADEHLWDPDRREDERVDEGDWHPIRDRRVRLWVLLAPRDRSP